MNRTIAAAAIRLYDQNGHEFFKQGQYNLNIFSVRTKGRIRNTFDDFIYCVYKDEYDQWRIHQWQCTTDPGTYWLKHPSRVEGTAILAPGQYKGVYKIDKHNGKYKALCQRNGSVRVYRDSNKDEVLDFETTMDGFFGINIHKAGQLSNEVNKWSAGCTVFRRAKDFYEFMNLVYKSEKLYGNKFTYTLFEEL